MNKMKHFLEWLSFHPSNSEIARALVTEYLVEFNSSYLFFGSFNSDDSITILGQHGRKDVWLGHRFAATEWRKMDDEGIRLVASTSTINWAPDYKTLANILRCHGVIQGFLIVQFRTPVSGDTRNSLEEVLTDFCVPLSLYLSFRRQFEPTDADINSFKEHQAAGPAKFTARQLMILRGMVEGKTNHELATEMGFSVSTIRHETMRIYQELSVSDRKEAAMKALTLSLV